MDMEQLVQEIVARVKERIAQESVGQLAAAADMNVAEKQIMVVNRKGCGTCGECWKMRGGLRSQILCTKSGFGKLPDADTKAIVALHLTELDVMKIAVGVASDEFTEVLVSGLLLGIPVFVPLEYAEFSSCASESAKRYRTILEEKQKFLESCGVRFLPEREVLVYLNADEKMEEERPMSTSWIKTGKNKRKRLLTERSIQDAEQYGQTQIVIDRKTIVTDLAKEYAYKRNIQLVYCD